MGNECLLDHMCITAIFAVVCGNLVLSVTSFYYVVIEVLVCICEFSTANNLQASCNLPCTSGLLYIVATIDCRSLLAHPAGGRTSHVFANFCKA